MKAYERYLTVFHILVGAIAFGFSVNGDGAVMLGMFTACFLALVLYEKILVRFLIGTAAVLVPMLAWGILLIRTEPSVFISKQYQEHGVLAFTSDIIWAVVAGVFVALVGVFFHKAKRYALMKHRGHKRRLISPIWIALSIGWILALILFYTWAISTRHDFRQYISLLDKALKGLQ